MSAEARDAVLDALYRTLLFGDRDDVTAADPPAEPAPDEAEEDAA